MLKCMNYLNFNKRLIVVDTEVTGKGEKDFIIELSAFEIINGKITGNIFHSFFNPKNKGYNFISKHKIPTEALQHTYKEDKNQFFNFLKFIEYDSIIICHNAVHDRKMINRSCIFMDYLQYLIIDLDAQ